MNWKSIAAVATRESMDSLETFFWDQGAVSVTVTDAGDEALYEPGPGEIPLWQQVTVTGLFEDDVDVEQMRDHLGVEGFGAVQVEELGDRIWEREWLARFRPMRFGENLWVCPGGQEVDAAGAVIMHLDPGLAFGTGTHPTTRLCLEWLDGSSLAGKKVVDYGCGSGILSIAALLLGCEQVIAVDNDTQALTATEDNARRNGVSERLTVSLPEQVSVEGADLVVANILAEPLRRLAHTLIAMLRLDGEIVLSGIMGSQKTWVAEAYSPAIEFTADRELDDWICIVGKKVTPL